MPCKIGIEKMALAKGRRHMTLVCDLTEATVEFIGEDRKDASVGAYFEACPKECRENVEAISLGVWPAYINACRDIVPGADDKMISSRFHIMRHVVEAVDTVRKQEHKALIKAGDDTLSQTKYLWLINPENLADKARERFAELKATEHKTGRAWSLKEALWAL